MAARRGSPGGTFGGVLVPRAIPVGRAGAAAVSRDDSEHVQEPIPTIHLGKRSQCKLVGRYEEQIVDEGIDGFPDEILDWYERSFGSSTVRLDGAVAFARADIREVWFALLPAGENDEVKAVEETLIPVAAEWNREHGHPELLNVQHL